MIVHTIFELWLELRLLLNLVLEGYEEGDVHVQVQGNIKKHI